MKAHREHVRKVSLTERDMKLASSHWLIGIVGDASVYQVEYVGSILSVDQNFHGFSLAKKKYE